jgi:hypothetical protein
MYTHKCLFWKLDSIDTQQPVWLLGWLCWFVVLPLTGSFAVINRKSAEAM